MPNAKLLKSKEKPQLASFRSWLSSHHLWLISTTLQRCDTGSNRKEMRWFMHM
jgi:hypothetical protein